MNWFLVLMGIFVAFVPAHWVVPDVLEWLREDVSFDHPDDDDGVPGSVVGWFERTFFTLAILASVSGAITGMVLWMGVKMAAHWDTRTESGVEAMRITALLGNLLSLFFALAGGLLIRLGAI